eukprot:8628445-Heterocapsa_arctica.AAC.1
MPEQLGHEVKTYGNYEYCLKCGRFTQANNTLKQHSMFSGEGTFVHQCSDSDNTWTSSIQWGLMDGGI